MLHHFTELSAYRKSSELAGRIFVLSRRWPVEERYSLTDQIRRSARAVGANLAEAWGKRRYEAHFISKLTDADAENHEVEHWLLTARRDGYISDQELTCLLEAKHEVGRILGSMIQSPEPFLLRSR
jgi:four helix bundle protein